jgi:hypothetical protein
LALCVFCGQKIWMQQRISTKKCCPCGHFSTDSLRRVLTNWRGNNDKIKLYMYTTIYLLHYWLLVSATTAIVRPFHNNLTPILLTWRIWLTPNNASRWQMGFNSVFEGLKKLVYIEQNCQFICDFYGKVAQTSFAFGYKTLCDRYAVWVL